MYVYSVIDYSWLIYYINGEIYAVNGKYWDYGVDYKSIPHEGYNEEKIIWGYPKKILSETDKMTIYNPKLNRYKKGTTIYYMGFDYYSKDDKIEDSVFVDIPSIESWGDKITKVKRIDYETLEEMKNK